MASKFLSRPDAKQRILRLDLSPVAPENKSALVVTAERVRLTYFVSDESGEWQPLTREHDPLEAVAVGPNDMLAFPWSRRNGVAAWQDRGVVVFKRSIGGRVGLYLDLIDLDPASPRLQTDEPLEIPLMAAGFFGAGIDIWARFTKEELLIVTQGWVRGQFDLLEPGPPEPRLILLKYPADKLSPDAVTDPAVWTADIMDRGGFDLDARLESGHVWAVHRRNGETVAINSDHFNSDNDTMAWIIDNPANNLNLDLSSLVGEYPPVVVVSCDPASGQSTVQADDLPGVERPQLHSVDPIIVTGDRLHQVQVRIEHHDGVRHFVPDILESSKWVIWRFRERWLTDSIGRPQHRHWPLHLEEIAGSQYMIELCEKRLSLGTLASLQPVVLADYQVTEKGRLVAFVIERPASGAVVTDFYRIGMFGGPDESLRWEGRNVLDIGHEVISRAADDQGNETLHPAEHSQFLPFFIDVRTTKPDGDIIHTRFGGPFGFSATRNTLGGLIVADQELGVGLLAYVGMDDGGGRVVFAPGVEPLPPTTSEEYKIFPPEILVDPIGPGRAWIELRADDWIDARLPGYFVPLNDVLRRSPVPNNAFTLLGLMLTEKILQHFTPRSIGSGLQLQLDALPFAAALVPDSNIGLDDINPVTFDLDQTTANNIQATIAGQVPPSQAFRSDGGPFVASFTITPGMIQAGLLLTFTATATPPTGPATFSWTVAPAGASSGFPPGFNPVPLEGPSPTFNFPFDGEWTVTLVATAADGATSTVTRTFQVAPSFWTQTWLAHRSISNDLVTVGSTTLEMSKFRLEYIVDAEGRRVLARINYLSEHRTQIRFLPGVNEQQGRVGLRLPVTISSEEASFRGVLATVLKLNRLAVSFNYERHYTPAIGTSDRRSLDIGANRMYAALDGTTAREADVETVRRFAAEIGRLTEPTPNAITARPVNQGELRLDDVSVDTELSDGAGGFVTIFSVILLLGLAGPLFAPIIAAIALASGPFAPIVALAGLGLLVLVAIALGLGLGALLRGLAREVLTDFATARAREELSRPAILATIREGLDDGALMTYAGEGVGEALAIMAIRQAIADGHGVEPPAHDQPDPDVPGQNRKPSGRERFRDQFFESIVVGEGICRIQLRVP